MRAPGQKPLQRCSWRCATSTARLEEAVDTFRAALTKRTRERVPLGGARAQNKSRQRAPSPGRDGACRDGRDLLGSARLRHTIMI